MSTHPPAAAVGDQPSCRVHGPMEIAEDAVLNGVAVRWWWCPVNGCRSAWQRTEQADVSQPDLFGGDAS